MFRTEKFQPVNHAFLNGDSVKVTFFVRNGVLIMAEECYFFLMASMRKMRMDIPLTYTLEFFQQLFTEEVINKGHQNAFIQLMVYRNLSQQTLQKSSVDFIFNIQNTHDVLGLQKTVEMDMIKEINLNTNLLTSIRTHCPENIYAEIYAQENDLQDLILLNPDKRIARSIYGNILLLQDKYIRLPKQSEGAYISPLMENFITFVHKNNLAFVEPSEITGFETQKADEILIISDEIGLCTVSKIRNKSFENERFSEMIEQWKNS
jgi:branched-subunit amino acid aminotransferase/4-amino-4-deoxychorismate lyase